MAITTLMATFVALSWKTNPLIVYIVNGSLLALDLLFVASTSTKLFDGGWFPLAISFIIAFLMLTWRKGQETMDQARMQVREKSSEFVERIEADPPFQIRAPQSCSAAGCKACRYLSPGTSSSITSCTTSAARRGGADRITRESDEERVKVTVISDRIARVELRVGFMESVDVPKGSASRWRAADCGMQSAGCDLLHRSRDHHPTGRYPRDGTLAREDFCADAPQCTKTRRLSQDSDRPADGNRDRIRD